jgi:hypothetical protein
MACSKRRKVSTGIMKRVISISILKYFYKLHRVKLHTHTHRHTFLGMEISNLQQIQALQMHLKMVPCIRKDLAIKNGWQLFDLSLYISIDVSVCFGYISVETFLKMLPIYTCWVLPLAPFVYFPFGQMEQFEVS